MDTGSIAEPLCTAESDPFSDPFTCPLARECQRYLSWRDLNDEERRESVTFFQLPFKPGGCGKFVAVKQITLF